MTGRRGKRNVDEVLLKVYMSQSTENPGVIMHRQGEVPGRLA